MNAMCGIDGLIDASGLQPSLIACGIPTHGRAMGWYAAGRWPFGDVYTKRIPAGRFNGAHHQCDAGDYRVITSPALYGTGRGHWPFNVHAR